MRLAKSIKSADKGLFTKRFIVQTIPIVLLNIASMLGQREVAWNRLKSQRNGFSE